MLGSCCTPTDPMKVLVAAVHEAAIGTRWCGAAPSWAQALAPIRPRFRSTAGRAIAHAPLDRRHPPQLTASTLDFRRILYVHQRYGVVRILKIGPPIVRGSSRGSLDAWIVTIDLLNSITTG